MLRGAFSFSGCGRTKNKKLYNHISNDTMSEKPTYELKGTLREDCMRDTATLEDFRALESDWQELFRWLMSVSGDIPWRSAAQGFEVAAGVVRIQVGVEDGGQVGQNPCGMEDDVVVVGGRAGVAAKDVALLEGPELGV